MKTSLSLILSGALALALALASPALADTNRFFIGVGLNFGAKSTPEGLLGFTHATTSDHGRVTGVKAELGLDIAQHFRPSSARLSGLYGHSNVQAEAGVGYDFESRSVFGLAGANAPFVAGGFTFAPRSGFGGYGQLLTLGKLKHDHSSALSLPPV